MLVSTEVHAVRALLRLPSHQSNHKLRPLLFPPLTVQQAPHCPKATSPTHFVNLEVISVFHHPAQKALRFSYRQWVGTLTNLFVQRRSIRGALQLSTIHVYNGWSLHTSTALTGGVVSKRQNGRNFTGPILAAVDVSPRIQATCINALDPSTGFLSRFFRQPCSTQIPIYKDTVTHNDDWSAAAHTHYQHIHLL